MVIIKHAAISVLLDSNINSLPITCSDVEILLHKHGCKIRSFNLSDNASVDMLNRLELFSTAYKYDVFTYSDEDETIVFYNASISVSKRHFAFAHELAHIVLGHIAPTHHILGFRNDFSVDKSQETEANEFALALLAPACILSSLNVADVHEISRYTLLDEAHAYLVSTGLCKKNNFTTAEVSLCNQFSDFISVTHRHKPKTTLIYLIILLLSIIFILTGIILYQILQEPQEIQDEHIITFTPEPQLVTPEPVTPEPQLITPEPQPTTDASSNISPANQSERKVVIAKTGTKYHRPGCQHVKNRTNTSTIPYSEAVSKGYTPCKTCMP